MAQVFGTGVADADLATTLDLVDGATAAVDAYLGEVLDVDIAAGVRESPGIRNLNSVLTLRLRFTLTRL